MFKMRVDLDSSSNSSGSRSSLGSSTQNAHEEPEEEGNNRDNCSPTHHHHHHRHKRRNDSVTEVPTAVVIDAHGDVQVRKRPNIGDSPPPSSSSPAGVATSVLAPPKVVTAASASPGGMIQRTNPTALGSAVVFSPYPISSTQKEQPRAKKRAIPASLLSAANLDESLACSRRRASSVRSSAVFAAAAAASSSHIGAPRSPRSAIKKNSVSAADDDSDDAPTVKAKNRRSVFVGGVSSASFAPDDNDQDETELQLATYEPIMPTNGAKRHSQGIISSSSSGDDSNDSDDSAVEYQQRKVVDEDPHHHHHHQHLPPDIVKVDLDKEICLLLRNEQTAPALQSTSFFIFPPRFILRTIVYNIIHTKVFEGIIICLILANCVFLAMDDPTAEEPDPLQTQMDLVFAIAFTVEMVIKMFALGLFMHKGSYLRSSWNVLDFVIVALSWANFIPGFGNYTAFRTLRVLRPLRSMNAIPGLKLLVIGLLRSFSGLVHVLYLALFIFCIFGILGVQLWGGLFRLRCMDVSNGEIQEKQYCEGNKSMTGMGVSCPEGFVCVEYRNPRFGYLNFDNSLYAFLAVFQVITFEGWSELMFITYDVFGYFAFIYYFILIMFGSYFVPNLALAVINEKFSSAQKEEAGRVKGAEEEGEARDRRKQLLAADYAKSRRSLFGNPLLSHGEGGSRKSGGSETTNTSDRKSEEGVVSGHTSKGKRSSSVVQHHLQSPARSAATAISAFQGPHRTSPQKHDNKERQTATRTKDANSNDNDHCNEPKDHNDKEKNKDQLAKEQERDNNSNNNSKGADNVSTCMAVAPTSDQVLENSEGVNGDNNNNNTAENGHSASSPSLLLILRNHMNMFTEGFSIIREQKQDGGNGEEEEEGGWAMHQVEELTAEEKQRISDSSHTPTTLFTKFIVLCIFLNTVVLAGQHYNEPAWFTDLSIVSNYVFTFIFLVECIMKMFGMSPVGYFRDTFNRLDFVIVVLSVIELFLDGSSTVSVFRALRLLRVLKIVKNMKSLRMIVRVVLAALADTAYLNLIMGLFLFIFALIGMQFFGGKQRDVEAELGKPVRPHYDNFLQSFFTVFQVITLDDWVEVMWNSMRTTNEAAVLFYIPLVCFGVYVILSLFLSILITGFAKESDSDHRHHRHHDGSLNDSSALLAEHGSRRGSSISSSSLSSSSVATNQHNQSTTDDSIRERLAIGKRNVRKHSVFREELEGAEGGRHPAVTNQSGGFGKWFAGGMYPVEGGGGISPSTSSRLHQNPFFGRSTRGAPHLKRLSLVTGISPAATPTKRSAEESLSASPSGSSSASPAAGPIFVVAGGGGGRSMGNEGEEDTGHGVVVTGTMTATDPMMETTLENQLPIHPTFRESFDLFSPFSHPSDECVYCRTVPQQALPAPPLVRDRTAKEFHKIVCHVSAKRERRTHILDAISCYLEEAERVAAGSGQLGKPQKVHNDHHHAEDVMAGSWSLTPKRMLEGADDEGSTTTNTATNVGGASSTAALSVNAVAASAADQLRNDIYAVLDQTRSCGMMLRRVPSEFTSYKAMIVAVEEEREIISWGIGEEQIGGALLEYTHSNLPVVHETNGGVALFVFGPRNSIRVLCSIITSNNIFENFILVCILISSIALALDNPREDDTTTKYVVLFYFDVIFTSIFVAEMLLKWVAKGLVMIKGSYLRDGWNWLDMIVVLISLISLTLTGVDVGFLKVIRTFRALRPLRVIQRNRGLKMVVRTLLQSVAGILHVAMLSGLNYLIFGILAVQFFAGKLHDCTDPTIVERSECFGHSYDDFTKTNITRTWRSRQSNFDHIGNSVLALFEVSAGELWTPIMYSGIDAYSDTHAPIRDHRPYIGLFFVLFFIISNFFLLNLFVGVVIHNFSSVKSQMDGLSLMTDEQKLWVDTQRMMLNFRPGIGLTPDLKSKASVKSHQFVSTGKFEAFIGVAILLNVVAIALDHHGMDDTWVITLQVLNYIFVLIFLVEAVLKIIAWGRRYFRTGWNQFDFFLVVISIAGVILDYTVGGGGLPIDVGVLRVLRIFRILRILRLVKRARNVRVLIETLWYSLPSIGNISIFMFVIYFVYAVLGVQLFAKVKPGVYIDNKYANYHNFLNALQMQFIFTTGEDWNSAMHDCMVQAPDCGTGSSGEPTEDCGNPMAAAFFYVSFVIVSSFVITNLFIAIILDNFDTTMQLDKSDLTMSDLHRYVEIWADFDVDATLLIPARIFPALLAKLQPPLGISRQYSRLEIILKTSHYNIPEHAGQIHFVEILIPLARAVMGVELTDKEIREHEETWKSSFPELNTLSQCRYRNRKVTVDKYFCATYIASAYRRRRATEAVQRLRMERVNQKEYFLKHGRLPFPPSSPQSAAVRNDDDDDDGSKKGNSPKQKLSEGGSHLVAHNNQCTTASAGSSSVPRDFVAFFQSDDDDDGGEELSSRFSPSATTAQNTRRGSGGGGGLVACVSMIDTEEA